MCGLSNMGKPGEINEIFGLIAKILKTVKFREYGGKEYTKETKKYP